MKNLLDKVHRRRLYILASFAILGLQLCAYAALLVLWTTNALDRHPFSLSRLSLVSQIISVTSQALAISSLAALTFLVQAVASDRVIRRAQKLAAIQDLLDAWRGIEPCIASLWQSRRLGSRVRRELFVVFLFFAASSVLQIVVPATVTVHSTNSTIPIDLRVTQRAQLTDDDFSNLYTPSYGNDLVAGLASLPNAVHDVNSPIGIPPGVERGTWFNTLPSAAPETVAFTDPHAQQPTVSCVSIPRRSGDRYKMEYESFDPGTDSLSGNFTSHFALHDGAVASFSAVSDFTGAYKFGGEKDSKEAPPNNEFNDTVNYLQWNYRSSSSNSTRKYGNIAFLLISTHHDVLTPDSFGLDKPVNQTLDLTVWSWIANGTMNDKEIYHSAFHENISVTFYYWPIVCTMYLEEVTAHVRGDNTMLSYTPHVDSDAHLKPFARPPPSSPYERAWGSLFDGLWRNEQGIDDSLFEGHLLPPLWLEQQVLQLLNETRSTSTQRIAALEAYLQSITSIAYSFLVQQRRPSQNLTEPTQGLQQISMARLRVHGLQTVLGLLSVIVLSLCVLWIPNLRDGLTPPGEHHIIVGDVLDLMCLMRGSSLPQLLGVAMQGPSASDARRDKAEKTNVAFVNFKLDVEDAKKLFPIRLALRPSTAHTGEHSPHPVPTLKKSLFIVALALSFLCCLHVTLIVLWARRSLNHRYFDLAKLSTVGQAIAIISQIGAVGALGLLSYGIQRIAADKFIRKEQTVQDLQDTLRSLSGLASAIHALQDRLTSSQPILGPIAQLFFFWLASLVLHTTMPILISVNTATVSVPVFVELDTVPGNIVDLGINVTALEFGGLSYDMHSDDLLGATSAVPYIWENRNATIHLPLGFNGTTLFSVPSNVSSSEYVFADPYAHSLSVRCGVIPSHMGTNRFSVSYYSSDDPQSFNTSELRITGWIQYTRPDGVTPKFTADMELWGTSNMVQFGGEKPTYDSPPHMHLWDTLWFSAPQGSWIDTNAELAPISFLFVSLHEHSVTFPPGVDYAPPIKKTVNMTVLSWVNDTKHPTTVLNGQPVKAFNESVVKDFFIWPLACVLATGQATATVLGNGTLKSLDRSDTPPHTAFPFMNEPKNQLESNWFRLVSAILTAEGGLSAAYYSWFGTNIRYLDEQHTLTLFEDHLASISSLAYALVIHRMRGRYASDHAMTTSSTWAPQYAVVTADHPVLRAHLQVNGLPLLVGSLSVVALGVVSAMCVFGHNVTDNTVRDGGVIDLISLLHNSALPDILAGTGEDCGNQNIGDALFVTRSARARETMVAYGCGSLDTPRRIQQREIEHLDALSSRRGDNRLRRARTETTAFIEIRDSSGH